MNIFSHQGEGFDCCRYDGYRADLFFQAQDIEAVEAAVRYGCSRCLVVLVFYWRQNPAGRCESGIFYSETGGCINTSSMVRYFSWNDSGYEAARRDFLCLLNQDDYEVLACAAFVD